MFKSFKKEKSKERLSMDRMTRDTCLDMVRIGSQLHKDTFKTLKSEIKDAKSIYETMGKKTIVNFKRFKTYLKTCFKVLRVKSPRYFRSINTFFYNKLELKYINRSRVHYGVPYNGVQIEPPKFMSDYKIVSDSLGHKYMEPRFVEDFVLFIFSNHHMNIYFIFFFVINLKGL